MQKQPLTIKYRPHRFEDLIGQPVIQKYYSRLIKDGQKARNSIFQGEFGSGKTTSARIYARALNCLSPTDTGSPCNVCKNCKANLNKSYTDLLEVDGATSGKTENIKEVKEVLQLKPLLGRYRIAIIDEAQGLSKQAWDSLLVLIEEPPPHLVLIFTTTDVEKIPPAVRSRCVDFEVNLIPNDVAVAHMRQICELENMQAEDQALGLLAFISEGHPRSILKNLEQVSVLGDITASNVKDVFNLNYLTNILKLFALISSKEDESEKIRSLIFSWGSSPAKIKDQLEEFLTMVYYNYVLGSRVVVNPAFQLIPKQDIANVFTRFKSLVESKDVKIEVAYSGMMRIINQTQVYNQIGLDVLLLKLHNYMHLQEFRDTDHKKLVQHQEDATSEAGDNNVEGKRRRPKRAQREFTITDEAQRPSLSSAGGGTKPPSMKTPELKTVQEPQTPTGPVDFSQGLTVKKSTPTEESEFELEGEDVAVMRERPTPIKAYKHNLGKAGFKKVMD